jgi:hypothetical protein
MLNFITVSEVRGSYGDDIAPSCVVGFGISEESAGFILRFSKIFLEERGRRFL